MVRSSWITIGKTQIDGGYVFSGFEENKRAGSAVHKYGQVEQRSD
jgi:hypothetical protein